MTDKHFILMNKKKSLDIFWLALPFKVCNIWFEISNNLSIDYVFDPVLYPVGCPAS